MTTRSRRYSTIGGLFILGITLMITYAYAFNEEIPYQSPIGTLNTCDAQVDASINAFNVQLVGPATFQTVANSAPGDPLAFTLYRVDNLSHPGNDPVLGPFVLSAEPARSQELSRIQAKVPFQAFPAISTLRFHGTLSLGIGGVYHSVDEVVIVNDNLTQWPHNNTLYTQMGTARFTNNCGGTVVLSNATVIVTAQ